MNLDQKARWQHVVIFLAAVFALCGAMILGIHLTGNATPKSGSWTVGAALLAGAVAVTAFAWQSLRIAARRDELDRLLAAGLFDLPSRRSDTVVRLNAELATHFGLSRADVAPPP